MYKKASHSFKSFPAAHVCMCVLLLFLKISIDSV